MKVSGALVMVKEILQLWVTVLHTIAIKLQEPTPPQMQVRWRGTAGKESPHTR